MNVGKVFERQFKKSVPETCFLHRLKDPPQAQNHSGSNFSWDNPCDFFMFDTYKGILWCVELKTTKGKSISFDDIYIDENKKSSSMIAKHQILSLKEFTIYDKVISGFLFNFRDEKNNQERTYFQHISNFIDMCKRINKKSFNELDLLTNGAIKVDGVKKRVHYIWDIQSLLDSIGENNK